MAKQVINVGTSANDGTGDKIRVAFQKTNANFTELYDGKIDSIVAGTNVSVDNTDPLNPIISALGGSGSGSVTSVGLTMPTAFSVANSPVTTSGTLDVTANGLASQYIRGDGELANFPTGGGGGGSSVSYYLNGSVTQGTFGGNVYKEMNKTPILGTGTDFTINADGYITQFITDANDPNSLLIPDGNWNFETYFSASSAGGTPSFYVELYKYSGTTFTLIASNSAVPELISLGISINPYFSALAVPETVLLSTDRLAIRIFVTHSGRTITLHTENSHLCQVITTFTTGLQSLNGLTAQTQYFDEGTSGTDFNISSVTDTHTFNLPTASATNRGALNSTDWNTFNNKQPYAITSFVTEITFDVPKIYFNFLAPTIGTLTSSLTGAKRGVVQKIYVNHATNPVAGLSGWKLQGTGSYTPSVVNIIYAEWAEGSRVEYWIVKATV